LKRFLLVLAAVAAATPAAAAPAPPARSFDWCSEVVVRPDMRRSQAPGGCQVVWPDEEAALAAVVLIGSASDVPEEEDGGRTVRCAIPRTHRDRGRYLARLRELRAKAGIRRPLRAIDMHRFDLVANSLAGEPGFRADFLATTDRPWREVLDFFARDRSPACGAEGCRFSFAMGGREDRGDETLRDRIDASGGAKRHETAVYYLARANRDTRLFWPTAAVADLRNRDYRAWRVAQAKRALELGGYDAIALNEKFHQHQQPHWIGSAAAPTPAALRESRDTLWTAAAPGYGYPEYVEAWSALARELRAAQIPYAITALANWRWLHRGADDPATPRDEARMIREVLEGARIVLVDRRDRGDPAGRDAWAARLEAAGAEVVWVDQSCGLARR
jgi:hypothetical protein